MLTSNVIGKTVFLSVFVLNFPAFHFTSCDWSRFDTNSCHWLPKQNINNVRRRTIVKCRYSSHRLATMASDQEEDVIDYPSSVLGTKK